jgi:orotidine-5'-phosphate decarboxylase
MVKSAFAKLIVALDVDSLKKAENLVDTLYPAVKIFKVGSQLFTVCGPEAVKMVNQKGAQVFLDLKFHDIPNTVKKAIEQASSLNVFMLTVHASGGREMLETIAAIPNRPKIIGVTVLTSQTQDQIQNKVVDLAKLAKDAGLDGVICSVHEAGRIRKELGDDFIIITPGIRLAGSAIDDQKRVATPEEAIKAGADFVVVGRPIIQADNPLQVAVSIIQDMQ